MFQWVKPPLVVNRSLEPTQVSGFNQVFDDGDGDVSWRRGVGTRLALTKQLFVGAEATWRNLTLPITQFVDEGAIAVFEKSKEQLHRGYLYWAPTMRLSLSGQIVYDTFDAEEGLLTDSVVPKTVKTLSVPLVARYFDPSGFFAGIGVTFIDQEVVRTDIAKEQSGFSDGSDKFFVVDASIGWRFPKRFGIATLTVNNLFNEKFHYQDDSFREFRDEPSTGPYIPALQAVGRITLYLGGEKAA